VYIIGGYHAAVGGGGDDTAASNAADLGMVVSSELEGNSKVGGVLEDDGGQMGLLGGIVEGVMGRGSMVDNAGCDKVGV
jgi:hypothetical protein